MGLGRYACGREADGVRDGASARQSSPWVGSSAGVGRLLDGFLRGSPGWGAHLGFGGSWGPPPCSFFTSISLLRLRASRSFPKEPLRRKEPLPSCREADKFVSASPATQPPGPASPWTHPAPLSCRPRFLKVSLRPSPRSPRHVSAATAVSSPAAAILQELHHLGLARRVQALRQGQGVSGEQGAPIGSHIRPCRPLPMPLVPVTPPACGCGWHSPPVYAQPPACPGAGTEPPSCAGWC